MISAYSRGYVFRRLNKNIFLATRLCFSKVYYDYKLLKLMCYNGKKNLGNHCTSPCISVQILYPAPQLWRELSEKIKNSECM